MRRTIAVVYLAAGLLSALICLGSMMWGVWGAPTDWAQVVGLLSSLALAGSAFAPFDSPLRRQVVCAGSVLGMGLVYVPTVVWLVPAESTIVSPFAYAIVLGYLLLVGVVLTYPQRLKGAWWVFAAVVLLMGGFGSATAWARWKDGEYDRPTMLFFLAERSREPLSVGGQFEYILPPSVCSDIQKEGLGGPLQWCGIVNEDSQRSKMVVIAGSRITDAMPLHYPKRGTVVYVWNGARWSTLPTDAECYRSFATLHPGGSIRMKLSSGGEQGYRAFPWE